MEGIVEGSTSSACLPVEDVADGADGGGTVSFADIAIIVRSRYGEETNIDGGDGDSPSNMSTSIIRPSAEREGERRNERAG